MSNFQCPIGHRPQVIGHQLMIWLILIVGVLAFLPALFWLFIYYKKDSQDPEPKRVIVKAFLVGALFALPFLGLRFVMAGVPLPPWAMIVLSVPVLAILEEVAKLSAKKRTATAVPTLMRRAVNTAGMVAGM